MEPDPAITPSFVTNPADPAAFPAGKGVFAEFKGVFAEFNVSMKSLFPAGKPEWSVIPGPNVGTTRFWPTAGSDAVGNMHHGGVSTMTHLTHLASWVEENRDVLERHGRVSFSYGPDGTDNPSAHLLVVLSNEADVELLVWESGDAEFNHGSSSASVFEHVELETADELSELLSRFADVVTRGS